MALPLAHRINPNTDSLELLCQTALEHIGEDPTRTGLRLTPRRFKESLLELTNGYNQDPYEIAKGAIFEGDYSEIVLVKKVEFYSLCEHHLLPFFGHAHIAYLPDRCIVGLSKIPQIVNVFARRLQVQERLTEEIASALQAVLKPRGVACLMEARHLCMLMRGTQSHSGVVSTTAMKGEFVDNDIRRAEFFRLVNSETPSF